MNETFRVEVWLDKTSRPVIHRATDAYEKGNFYCVREDNRVTKYPIAHIFRIREDYHPLVAKNDKKG